MIVGKARSLAKARRGTWDGKQGSGELLRRWELRFETVPLKSFRGRRSTGWSLCRLDLRGRTVFVDEKNFAGRILFLHAEMSLVFCDCELA